MIEEPKLLRIAKNLPRPSVKQIEALKMVPTGVANDAMWGKGAFTKAIKYFDPSSPTIPTIVGPALTVDTGRGYPCSSRFSKVYKKRRHSDVIFWWLSG